MTLPITSHEKASLENLLDIKTNPLAEKIGSYVAALFQYLIPIALSLETNHFIQHLYTVTQSGLSALGCAGFILTLLISITGFPKLALCTATLSIGNLVGAYTTYQASIQQSLKKSTKELEKHVSHLAQINNELKVTNEDLKKTNEELKNTSQDLKVTNEELKNTSEELKVTNEHLRIEVDLFSDQNEILREEITNLGQVKNQLAQEVGNLNQAIHSLTERNQELQETGKTLQTQVELFGAQNAQFHSLAQQWEEETQKFTASNEVYSETQKELLCKFSQQITHSRQFWKKVEGKITNTQQVYAEIIEEQKQFLNQLRNSELHEALKADILKASEKYKELIDGNEKLKEEIQEATNQLQEITNKLQEATQKLQETEAGHREILEEHRKLLKEHREVFSRYHKEEKFSQTETIENPS